jgi:hypothetical protein
MVAVASVGLEFDDEAHDGISALLGCLVPVLLDVGGLTLDFVHNIAL